jgi:glucokinase
LETYANQYSIIERMRARLKDRRNSPISELMAKKITPLHLSTIIQAAEAGDADAIEVIREAGTVLGVGVGNLINIFNPEMVVIGGPLSAARRFLLPPILERAKEQALSDLYQQVEILFSASGPDASLIGAVALVVESILHRPTRVQRLVVDNPNLDEAKGGDALHGILLSR